MANTTSWPKLWESRIGASFQKQLQDWIDANDPRSELHDALPRAKNFVEQAETIVLEDEIKQWRIVNEKERRDLNEVMPHAKDILIRFMTKPEPVRKRMDEAGRFLLKTIAHRWSPPSLSLAMKATISSFSGIDFSQPVKEVHFHPLDNQVFVQWFRGRLGNWFAKPGCAWDQLGIIKGEARNVFSNGRSYRLYKLKQVGLVDALESTASSVMDFWTDADQNHILTLLTAQNPKAITRTVGSMASGGGIQYFVPNPEAVMDDITVSI